MDGKPSWRHILTPPIITATVALFVGILGAVVSARHDVPGTDVLFPRPTATTTVTATATATITTTVTPSETTPTVTTATAGGASTYLADMDPVEGGLETEPRAILKKSYAHAVSNQMGGCSQARPTEWVLGTGVSRFQAWIGLDDISLISTAKIQFMVTLDGKKLVTKTLGLKQVEFIDVPVQNGLRLKLDTVLVEGNVRNNCNTEAIAVWGDAAVTTA
jgi:NPCBM/NEW2 domain